MITEKTGDVLTSDLRPGVIIVHGCNCLGVMGAGVALAVKIKYPAAYDVYMHVHNTAGLKLGDVTIAEVEKDIFVINANTQHYVGGIKPINYEAVAQCFTLVQGFVEAFIKLRPGIKAEVRFPKIGSGLGGGNWNIISTIIDETITLAPKVLYTL